MLFPTPDSDITVAEGLEVGDVILPPHGPGPERTVTFVAEPRDGVVYFRAGRRDHNVPVGTEYRVRHVDD